MSNKTLLSGIVFCPCFLPTFFPDPFERLEVYDQFYYRHETSFLLLLLYKYLRFQNRGDLEIDHWEFFVPSSSAIRTGPQLRWWASSQKKSMHFLSPAPPSHLFTDSSKVVTSPKVLLCGAVPQSNDKRNDDIFTISPLFSVIFQGSMTPSFLLKICVSYCLSC